MCNKTNKQARLNSFNFSFVEDYKNCEIYFSEALCAFFSISATKKVLYWCSHDGIKFAKASEDYEICLKDVKDQIDLQDKK